MRAGTDNGIAAGIAISTTQRSDKCGGVEERWNRTARQNDRYASVIRTQRPVDSLRDFLSGASYICRAWRAILKSPVAIQHPISEHTLHKAVFGLKESVVAER